MRHVVTWRRSVRRVALGVAMVALVAGSVGVSRAAPAGAAACGPAPSGMVAVALVVDRGSQAPSTRCAVVAQGSTGLDALRAAGHDVRLDGGFVCGIDGLPATGCGNRPDAGFAYWRYWHADPGGAWSYSQVGAGGYRLPARCAVEGWVWSDAPSSNTPPRLPAPAPTCEAPTATAPPSTARPATPPPTTVAAGPGAPVGPADPGNPSGAPTGGGAAAGADGTTTVPPAQVAGASTVAPGAAPTADDPDPAGSDGERSGSVDGREATRRTAAGEGETELAAAPSADGSSSTVPWGPVVALGLIVALGAGAWIRSRTRSAAG